MTTGTVIQRAFPGLSHIGAERLVPFYPPVDGKEFDGDEGRRRKARSILGVPADVPLVVCLANLNPQKGIEGLLGACAKAISDGARLAVRVRGSESPAHAGYRERLEALAVDLGLGGNCVGSLESELTPADFLSGGDIFAIASCARSEGVPTALLEAMSSRLPIVATRVGGISEIVSDECGVTVPPGDGAALAAALQSAVEWPRSRRLALGGAGRTFVETHASTAACVDAHVSAYSRVLGIRGASTASGSRSLASNVRTLSNPENIDRR
jgi:starch synthase (maltosyl-transferring)